MNADLSALHHDIAQDDVYLGSSNMVQLVLGQYDQVMHFTVEGVKPRLIMPPREGHGCRKLVEALPQQSLFGDE